MTIEKFPQNHLLYLNCELKLLHQAKHYTIFDPSPDRGSFPGTGTGTGMKAGDPRGAGTGTGTRTITRL